MTKPQSTNQIRMTNDRMGKRPERRHPFRHLVIRAFGFDSSFGLRHSGFRRRLFGLLAALLPFAAAPGCTSHPRNAAAALPTYPWVDEQTALRTLAARADAVRTVQAEASMTLTRAGGDSVQLDGAVVLAPPGRARLRAWKFNQAVFDLTLTPEGVWVMAPTDPGRREKVMPATAGAAQFVRNLDWVTGAFFKESGLVVETPRGKPLVVSKVLDDEGRVLRCEVERDTLTPRKYTLLDPAGKGRFVLTLGDYQDFGGIVWPKRLRARGDTGTIDVRLRDVEFNTDPAPRAFVPPRRAEKLD